MTTYSKITSAFAIYFGAIMLIAIATSAHIGIVFCDFAGMMVNVAALAEETRKANGTR